MNSTLITLTGYQITETLYRSSRTLVYRGLRESDQIPVVIKLLNTDYPSFGELVRFRNQFTIAKNLDIPGIVKPYCLEHYRHSYALVMEDFGGISLGDYSNGQPMSLGTFFPIALQIVTTLQGLYRQGVIHKDIKPANMLINPDTKQVKLIDFSLASVLPRETQVLQSPNVLEGTLAYLSPEQTGRMNRSIDYRSDFYSLGVTFFELLTGQLPFPSTDPMELVHCHIAKRAPAVDSLNGDIPAVLSMMIGKLMGKNAEDRYQNALGLKHDLEICFKQWQETGRIESFNLGSRDICVRVAASKEHRFVIPEKLYGRASEVETLLAAFERVSNSPTAIEMILVAGFSGIGKTSVVNEVHKPIVRQRGYFIKGKFDQFQRNIPFSAFVQAFRDLMGQLLSETDAQLQQWKTIILTALTENGQVIIEVIPELERIIGKQPPVPELSGSAAQNRFNRLFQKFIQVFTTPEHPLVIFLDDLQWADLASLKLMQLLMSETETGYLLLIGAYRDNEVFPAHPLMVTLDQITKTKATVNTITLAPLKPSDLNCLIADTLHCAVELAAPLTELVYQKTQGNPFFATQFLKSLPEDGLISFNFESGYWQCDIAQIKALAVTDDVVKFMALQLKKLPVVTQEILQLAACIGNQFDLATLAIVHGKSEAETAANLWKALQEGFILPITEIYKFFQDYNSDNLSVSELKSFGDLDVKTRGIETLGQPVSELLEQEFSYRFLHDRVQQAAYFMIPEDQKQSTHWKIGQLLLENTSLAEREEKIFDIVSQLNYGVELIYEQVERDELAQLNLMAGRKAKASTAYAAAVEYLRLGMTLLAADSWHSNYDLTLSLYQEAAQSEYLSTNFDRAIALSDSILAQATKVLDCVKADELKVQIYIGQDYQSKGIEIGLEALEKLKIPLVSSASGYKNKLVKLPSLRDLATMPTMTNPEQLAALRILLTLAPPIHRVKPNLYPYVALTMIGLCLNNGHSSLAAGVYVIYGVFLREFIEDLESAYHSGQIALRLLEQYQAKTLTSKVHLIFSVFICPGKEHGRATLNLLREGIQRVREEGNIEYVGYFINAYFTHLYLLGESLVVINQEASKYMELLVITQQRYCLLYTNIWKHVTLSFQGLLADNYQLVSDDFNEHEMFNHFHENNNYQSLFTLHLAKLIIRYTFHDYQQAVIHGSKAIQYEDGAFGLLVVVTHNFYYSLALLAQYPNCDQLCCAKGDREAWPTANRTQQEHDLNQVKVNQTTMGNWANHAPSNFQHKYNLVAAEIARVVGDTLDAMELYDLAIAGAKDNEYLHEEALANELAARFYLERGKPKIAQVYLTDAYYAYARWGAKAKVEDLEQRYPELLAVIQQQQTISLDPSHSITTDHSQSLSTLSLIQTISSNSLSVSDALDLATVIKASQAIAREIQLEQLFSTLMKVIIEHAGAEKCALILPKAGKWVIDAYYITHPISQGNSESDRQFSLTVLQSIPVVKSRDIPVSVINYVAHSSETLVLDNATVETMLAADLYIIEQQPKSILCTPILNHGQLIGIVYLENNQCTGAFTKDRLEILELLCSQAAISLENANLYNTLEEKVAERTQELSETLEDLKATQKQLVESETKAVLSSFVAGVTDEISTPVGNGITAASTLADETLGFLRSFQEGKLKRSALQNYLEVAQESSELILSNLQRAGELVQNLRQVAVDQDDLEKRRLSVKHYLEEVLLTLEPKLKQTPHGLTLEGDDTVTINTYPGAIWKIITHLVINSITHAYQPSEQGQLTLTVERIQDQVMLKYDDDGCGIPQEHVGKIFEPFFTTARPQGRTGLGLHIVYNLVTQKLLGQIEVKSEVGKGTEFMITLPIG
ncbi:trifunctional serine/threonine-protein kinase/ATP-binding protein/sensor histidine kinase [Moorena producens JHB]|uniref:histidine kinase n=1 Tax=Moorena producens (strain JHB) TaxID=1454205 RepID=A0A1D9G4W4_MOOP1|nr:ATP-binding sensor histidine kinase [Moorena producens]AOY82689.1 trifunctional serine/threonine-protein kinase/ATP-binding protein/sensor histidine kinase [Moorena producens JHB]